MPEKVKLTEAQRKVLYRLSAGNDAFWSTRTEKILVERGLIERCDSVSKVGGMEFRTHRCRLTEAGRAQLTEGK